ncbi:MAG: class I SAM-dependent methyltransferase, partial [Chloroflexi bacterium]|nr:class I SAM-dependent methyltransferase [Chloroflexota bacterium]
MIEKRTGEFYERDAATYDRRWVSAGGGATLTSQRQIVCDLGGEWRGRRILEVGCGTGRFSPFVAETAKETAFVDLSIEMLKTTRRKLHPMGKPFAGVNASIYRLPIRDNTFDGALCVNVFNHLDSPDLALRELARVLTPKGTLVVNFANRQSYYWPAAFVINRRRRAIGRNVFSSWLSPSEI